MEDIKMMVNNKVFAQCRSLPEVVNVIIEADFFQLKYASLESMKENFKSLADMIKEMGDHLKKELLAKGPPQDTETKSTRRKTLTQLTRTSKYLMEFSGHFSKVTSREKAQYLIYNILLANEGKGLLHGFGYANAFKDVLKGDPEKDSLLKVRKFTRGD